MYMIAAQSLTPAIFGLLGVLVGALVTGLVNWLLERSRQKADAHAAARLLKTEVAAASEQAERASDEGKWPIAYRPTWRQSWGTYRRPLAALMPRDDFDKVAVAYAVMDEMQGGFTAGRAEDKRGLSTPDHDLLATRAPAALQPAEGAFESFIVELEKPNSVVRVLRSISRIVRRG